MSGKEIIENGTIILKNNRIEKVGKSDEIQLPKMLEKSIWKVNL